MWPAKHRHGSSDQQQRRLRPEQVTTEVTDLQLLEKLPHVLLLSLPEIFTSHSHSYFQQAPRNSIPTEMAGQPRPRLGGSEPPKDTQLVTCGKGSTQSRSPSVREINPA